MDCFKDLRSNKQKHNYSRNIQKVFRVINIATLVAILHFMPSLLIHWQSIDILFRHLKAHIRCGVCLRNLNT